MRVARANGRQPKRDSGVADLGAVEDAMEHWTPEMIKCREGRHNWPDGASSVDQSHPSFYYQVQWCARGCGVKRHREISRRRYLVVSSRIDYSEAATYLMPKGTGRLDQDGLGVVRGALLRGTKIKKVRKRDARPPSQAMLRFLEGED